MNSLWGALARVAAESPGLPCLCIPARPDRSYCPAGLEWSYGEIAEIVQPLIDRYVASGWGHSHRVALLLENRPEFMLHFLALNAIGAWVVPINPDYRSNDLAHLFSHAEPDLVVALDARVDYLASEAQTRGLDLPVVAVSTALAELPKPRRRAVQRPVSRDDEAILLYTSGTTGLPKGCLIANDYLFFAGQRYIDAGDLMTVRHGGERLYNPLPLFYANSLSISNPAMILSRNAMIFPDRFHASSWWREIVETRATIVHYLGLIAPVLLSRDPVPEEHAHTVRFGVGAGLDPDQHRAFEERFGFPLIEVWGMSEVGICTAAKAEPRHVETRNIGTPLNEIEIDAWDEAGKSVGVGKTGELVLRRRGGDPRAGLFRGYFKDRAATEKAWTGGWFHTGDIVRRDTASLFTFFDRMKHMIRRSGQNIAAVEVEACLRAHPNVREVAVVAVSDDNRQEEVMACVVPREGDTNRAAAEDIVRFALARLAYFKVPGWILFTGTLPTTATQKLQKSTIFAEGEDPRLRPDVHDLRSLKARPSHVSGQQ